MGSLQNEAIGKITQFFAAPRQRGELRQRYREGQEDQLGALGLLMNVVVLWNTLYLVAGAKCG
jgi:TnpA family transposase